MRKKLKLISLLIPVIICLAIIPVMAQPTYTLEVDSFPQGIEFTLDSVAYTTPWSGALEEGDYTIEMPLFAMVGEPARRYIFDWWEDGSGIHPDDLSNLTRTVTVAADTAVTANYGWAYNITAISPPIVYIDPALIEDPDATQVTVDIVASPGVQNLTWFSMTDHIRRQEILSTVPIEDLWGAQFSVHYEPRIVNGFSKSVNLDFLGSAGGTANEIEGPGFDDENGELGLFGMYLEETEDPWVAPEVYEATVLATVTFDVVGSGVTCFRLGDDTKLKDAYGDDFDRELYYGTFRNADAELYMGPAKGGKIWPSWKHGFVGEPNILYGRFTNLGVGGVHARVRFIISSAFGTDEVVSNAVWAEPGETQLVSAVYTPPGPGTYLVRGVVEFKYDGCTWIDYLSMESTLGGDGITRDIGTKFWVG